MPGQLQGGEGWAFRNPESLCPRGFQGGEEAMGASSPGEHAGRALGTAQGVEGAEPAGAQGMGAHQAREQQLPGARSSQEESGQGGSASSNATEQATVIRTPKCLSDLAIRRSSVTSPVAMGAVGGQEAGVEGVEAGKAGKALPREKITSNTKQQR